jgi:hypothetical protein
MWHIIFKDGFVLERYTQAVVIRLSTEERELAIKHNVRFSSKDPLLPTLNELLVPLVCYSLTTKNHLVWGTKAVDEHM